MGTDDQKRYLTWVAGAAIGALVSTALPYVRELFLTRSALEAHPFLLVPPGVALAIAWVMWSGAPASFTPGKVMGLRLAFGAGIVLWLIDASTIGNSGHLVEPEVGFIAYVLASGFGVYATFHGNPLAGVVPVERPSPLSNARTAPGAAAGTPVSKAMTVACPSCGKDNIANRSTCVWCDTRLPE